MEAIQHAGDVMTKLVPGGERSLAHVGDKELLANTRRLVGKSNQVFAALLAHLAEVETRGLHRSRLCASLYTYCIYELRFSEDAAARRSSAARLVKQFPVLFDAIANGELHLTGLLMIGPHLTPENHVEVLGRAKFRTKKELGKLVRELNPLPHVPDLIQPLRPAPARANLNPSWEVYIESLSPAVRELKAGERPRDWVNDGTEQHGHEAEELPVGPAPSNLPPVTGPQHYQLQFSTGEQHVQLVERAKALLAKSKPGISLGELHFEAMKLLVMTLEKQKFAVTSRPRARAKIPAPLAEVSEDRATRQRGALSSNAAPESTRQRGAEALVEGAESLRADDAELASTTAKRPEQRSRYIPAAERRAVFEHDEARCTFTDEHGGRCRETHYLEIHHLVPFEKLGPSIAVNLTLRCASHNALAAEQDFGRESIGKKRDALRHESLRAQAGAVEMTKGLTDSE